MFLWIVCSKLSGKYHKETIGLPNEMMRFFRLTALAVDTQLDQSPAFLTI